ncbi:Uncharacterised protein [Mycobacteroides abscessus subsp. abscessus]|nr:Uncharacterised protein [Mycobacteroides abscessus subsp. abscessus]
MAAETGITPPPSILPDNKISGITRSRSTPHHCPNLPSPVWISSATSSAPYSSHTARRPARYPSGGMMTPASPCTGSTITHARAVLIASSVRSAARSPYGTWLTPGNSGRNGAWNTSRAVKDSAPNVFPW